jgi:hypothetical protein
MRDLSFVENLENVMIIWERVRFDDGVAVSWEKSYDKGKTWQAIEHPFKSIPFVMFESNKQITEIVRVKWEEKREL